jgi:ketosteroid isomerase-like protein
MSTTVKNANDLHKTWAERFNARDLEGMVALAEPDSAFVPQPGTVVTGDGVRKAEEQFLQMGLPITLVPRRAIVNGDIALLISDWTITGKASDGSDVNLSGTTADVARRGPDGWKYVIDNPFGTA